MDRDADVSLLTALPSVALISLTNNLLYIDICMYHAWDHFIASMHVTTTTMVTGSVKMA